MNAATAKLIRAMAQRLNVSEKVIKRRWLALSAEEKASHRRAELRAGVAFKPPESSL